jgi:hypothetical protein
MALAQPGPEGLRAGLLRQADQARGAGDHARAVTLLRAALAIRPATPLRWALAFELLQVGDLPGARIEAQSCVDGAGPADATASSECRAIIDRARDREQGRQLAAADVLPTLPPSLSPPAPTAPAGPVSVRSPSRAGPVALLVAGGVGVAVAGVLWGAYASQVGACDVAEGEAWCRTELDADRARGAPALAWAGDVALGLGLASIAAGVLWWVLAPARTTERPGIALGPGGAVLRW